MSRVYVSSTSLDLTPERSAAFEAGGLVDAALLRRILGRVGSAPLAYTPPAEKP